MLAFLFLRYLLENYEAAAKKELERTRKATLGKHNSFLKELGLPLLP